MKIVLEFGQKVVGRKVQKSKIVTRQSLIKIIHRGSLPFGEGWGGEINLANQIIHNS